MNNVPDNQSNYRVFDASARVLRLPTLFSILHSTIRNWNLPKTKSFALVSAAGLLTFTGPVVFALAANDQPDDTQTHIDFQQQSSASNEKTTTDASLTVNGKTIPVPQNGTATSTITDDTQTTSINVDSHSAQTGTDDHAVSEFHSSVRIDTDSSNQQGGT